MVTESTSRQAPIQRLALTGMILLALLLAIPFGPARADGPQPGIFIYTISRDGEPIGQQRTEFVSDGEKLRVITHLELSVTLLGMGLYGYNQQIEEVRAGDKILSLTSEADDDGTDRKVNLKLDGDLLKGDYNGDDRALNPTLATSLFWQKPQLGDVMIIDCLKGRTRELKVEDVGPELLALPVGQVKTHHYKVTGDWKRDLWYDENGVLVAGQLTKDGAKIRQELQQRP